ncbi:hypothetical protein BU24DRAFT_30557 [Aaosphaeria arxii CBS 175.79]|uniref:Uncharacterized protein n=1 Tax=Aaosphaeria arxii CBS 175.79 TaxID=1450172 RepID=A0A6A5Y928_9PLEO|nr:uncharacterized protein BU24DRAFT_30557 [Aaosphaeria arxii CBS 175.79]KAF2021839.1 hypothetical protein BU24DRAFT_30557 [Aaosphaeria arxii CBS 175.79]
MSSPPQTPTHRPASSHRRYPSSLDMSHNATPSRRHSLHRRSSGYSPMTPQSSHGFEPGSPVQNNDGGGDNELGNLADELGDIWDDEEEEGVDGDFGEELELPQEGENGIGVALDHDGSVGHNGVPRDSGVVMQSSSPDSKTTLSPFAAAKQNGRRHQRQRSLYDGSDYGDDSDLEVNEGISAGLERQMAGIESLARRGIEENGSSSDQVVKRFMERLRDLGSQTSIENGAMRLKTTHDALASHLTHQSRTLTSLSASFSGPRAIIPDPETIDSLLPLINSTLELLPHASPEALHLITQLTFSNREMSQHLSNVSDSLHMSRQGQTNAARRLKTAKDQLADWKKETDLRDQGIHYIESGDWDRKLKERDAKRDCGSVLEGFEETCGMWRKRLCEGLNVASA